MPLLYAERMAISGVAVATPERLALTPLGSVAVGAATAAAVHMRSRYKRHVLICGTGRYATQRMDAATDGLAGRPKKPGLLRAACSQGDCCISAT